MKLPVLNESNDEHEIHLIFQGSFESLLKGLSNEIDLKLSLNLKVKQNFSFIGQILSREHSNMFMYAVQAVAIRIGECIVTNCIENQKIGFSKSSTL